MRAMTIGELKKRIEAEGDKRVNFSFGSASPTRFDSYRGYYDQPALGYSGRYQDSCRTADLLNALEIVLSHVYEGWKGGHFSYTEDHLIRVANPGNCSDTFVVGCRSDEYSVTLLTAELLDDGTTLIIEGNEND